MTFRTRMKAPTIVLAAAIALVASSPAFAYAVICVHGKYDVDSRDDAQLKMAFGTSYCLIRRFEYRSHAEDWAKANNMKPGTKCTC
jgi:heme/copper-type cytochrome/quinol oxidase subunit 3